MSGFVLPESWPAAADTGAGERLVERFAGLGRVAARLAAKPGFRAMLMALGGNSPYLADLALREAASLRELAARGPEAVVARAMAAIARTPPQAKRDRVVMILREAKRQVALATALADIGGIWALDRVTGALAALAEAALGLAVGHLLRAAHDAGELRLPDPAAPGEGSGFTVLGMGKLGASELNYSSDIDLVLLYDPDLCSAGHPELRDGLGAVFSRLARAMVSIMEARDADGYVFRTDLRLRPDPAATPPAIALPAALAYYESMGQNWERAAMIKARPVAGDIALGTQFLVAIRPFIWRRHLDFAAIAEIHTMKRRIDEQQKTGPVAPDAAPLARIAGLNVKLGRGGIREIEFVTQTLELVWGGRDPGLREPRTLPALRLLARAGHLPQRAAAELASAYRYLRRVEHRLQMVADRQTHSLPSRSDELARFAIFMGHADPAEFARVLLRHLDRVWTRYTHLFEGDAVASEDAEELDFAGIGPPTETTLAALSALGFRDTARIVAAVRGWQAGRVRAVRSERARALMREVLPALLAALGRQKQPDQAFVRFETFFARLPAGVQLLSLFQRNPALLDRVAAVLGAAPSLADHLAHVPSALEGLLSPGEADPAPLRTLETQLADAALLEPAIEIIRRAVRGEEFRLDVGVLEARIGIDEAGEARTALADAAMATLLPRVLADFAERNGRVRGGAMVVVALGKAGGHEMLAGSDLDLMLVYDHPPGATESTGARRMAVSQYYIRAAHAFVAALTAPGLEGPLYAVDMRLRPSGNKGPVAVPLAGFRRYHAEDAWTWERMALTRARVVAGPPVLARKVERAIRDAIRQPGDPLAIRADARAMRARLARDLPPGGPWAVKLLPGGLMEVEFVAQALELIHATAHPGVLSQTTRVALARLRDAGLLPAEDAALLIRADQVWRGVQGVLRLVLGRAVTGDPPEAAMPALLHAAGGGVDLASLRVTLDRLARDVRAVFIRHIGDPELQT